MQGITVNQTYHQIYGARWRYKPSPTRWKFLALPQHTCAQLFSSCLTGQTVKSRPGHSLFHASGWAGRWTCRHVAGARPRRPAGVGASLVKIDGARAFVDVHFWDVAVTQPDDWAGWRQTVSPTPIVRYTRLHSNRPAIVYLHTNRSKSVQTTDTYKYSIQTHQLPVRKQQKA